MADPGKPTYMELVAALRAAPWMRGIGDDRYREWYVTRVLPLLERVPEPQ